MPTKSGLHIVSGSRNGYGQVVGMACVLAVNEGGALVEAKSNYTNTVTIFRLTEPSPFYLEAPQGMDSMTVDEAVQVATNIYPLFKQKWQQNPSDYYTVLNEPFNEQPNIPVYLAYERQLIDLAHADGFRICMLNLAGGSPSMGTWESHVAPHLEYGFSKGAIYGRHAYGGDIIPLNGNTSRPLQEAEYLSNNGINGGIVITEFGLDGGYGYYPDKFVAQMPQYDLILQDYPNIIGFCWWTLGNWNSQPSKGNSNYQDSMAWYSEYVGNNPADKWQPEPLPPIDPPTPLPPTIDSIIKIQHTIKQLSNNPLIDKLADETIDIANMLECEELPDNDDFYIIDISKWQENLDWQYLIDKGVKGVYIRASQGLRMDGMINTHYTNAKHYGLKVGFYHYLDVRVSVNEQAMFFADMVMNYDYDMPLAIDVEENQYSPLPNYEQVRSFVEQTMPLDDRMVIYSSAHYYNQVSTTDNFGCELWVAHYGATTPDIPKAWDTWHLWQFTSEGFETGQSLDVNRFNGSLSDYNNWLLDDKPIPSPEGDMFDVWSYMCPYENDNVTYEVRHQDGSQERIQNQIFLEMQSHHVGIDTLYIVKGENQGYWEKWQEVDDLIHLRLDTSPANDSQGNKRFYGIQGGAWCKRYMRIGETFNDGGHYVQFYAKSDCRELSENSGYAENNTTLIAHYPTVVKNGIILNDCIKVGNPDGETHIFCKGIGRIAWYSGWGNSEISELHEAGTRPIIQREVIGCL